MKFEIKHRFSGSILFSVETESLKIAVELAVKGGAYLGGAYLRGADLRGAYLGGADLRGAYLGGADLRGADLRGAYLGGAYLRGAYLGGAKIRDEITVSKSPIQVSGLEWDVTIWDNHMQIGCEFHSHEEWRGFTAKEWMRMGGKPALIMQRDHFPALIMLCDQHAASIKAAA